MLGLSSLPASLSGVLAGDRVLESELKRIPTVGWGGKGSLSLLPAGNPGTDPLGLAGDEAEMHRSGIVSARQELIRSSDLVMKAAI